MKRLMVFAILAAMILGASFASAAEMKVTGEFKTEAVWSDNWDGQDGSHDNGNEDDFDIRQRARIVFRYSQSENLSAVVRLQYGGDGVNNYQMKWGNADSGGQIDTDSNKVILLKRAYIEFKWPGMTDLLFQVGKLSLSLPGNFGSSILGADTTTFLTSYKINDMVSVAAGFARAVDGAGRNNGQATKNNDEWDHIFAILPLTFDGLTVTPFANFSIIGNNINRNNLLTETGTTGLLTPNMASAPAGTFIRYNDDHVYPWWAGVSVDMPMFDPIVIKGDFNYGSVDDDGDRNDRSGWLADLEVSFTGLQWFVPKAFGLYASGEDDSVSNGSERMPNIVNDFAWGSFYYGGSALMVGDLDNPETGTWAIGLSLADIKFIDKLSHTATVMYIQGTNDKDIVSKAPGYLTFQRELTTDDHVWEFDFNSKYMIYEQLATILELGYLINDLDEDVWGRNADDSWKIGLGLQYTF